ncbi:MAG TPA: LysM peptidoglycan-binding domain-containing protein [Blastocatellia bacterium]|nr:LysM peptidoglycan-binding domain-containing protein [Blastocatellia bacterium]
MPSLDELKSKYNAVFEKGHEVGLALQNVNLEGDKLLIRGVVPSEYAKDQLWNAIKSVDSSWSDLTADINVQPGQEYTVQSGDTLSKIAKRFYGDPNQYHAIFNANTDKLSDPDKIQVGQKLKLP